MANTDIDAVDPLIAAFHEQWRRNRLMVEGERAVKRAGITFLPKDAGLEDVQYQNIRDRTPFFPGAARTHSGFKGLILRKPATIIAPDWVRDRVLPTITSDGYTLDDLAEDLIEEFDLTGFVGLLTDQPARDRNYSMAEVEALGLYPQISMYIAESILCIEAAKVNNRLRVVRVRLLDDQDTVRELRLDDGIYNVVIWRRNGGAWQRGETFTPKRGEETLDEIPFSLLTDSRKYQPSKARITDIVELNVQHFIASSNLATCDYWVSHPTPYVFGPKVDSLTLAPGAFLSGETKGGEVKIGMLEYSGAAISQLAERRDNIANDMAKIGARILAPDKATVEAAETVAVKTASENASISGMARLISRWINDQAAWVAWWLDLPEDAISYQLNADFTSKLTDAEIKARVELYQGNIISLDTLTDMLITGEVLLESYDRELDQQKIAEAVRDRPPVDAIVPLD